MKAALLKKLNGPPEFDDFEDPVAGEGQVIVEIAAAAIQRLGTHYLPPIWGYFSLRWLRKQGFV